MKGASIKADATPEYLGVGYIIGPRVAGVIFAGGVFSWLVLMPLIYFFGKDLPHPVYPGTIPIAQMGPSDLWATYIRPMGAGAVAAAGLITLHQDAADHLRRACRRASRTMRPGAAAKAKPIRTENDLSMGVVRGRLHPDRGLHVSLSPIQARPWRAMWAGRRTLPLRCWWSSSDFCLSPSARALWA